MNAFFFKIVWIFDLGIIAVRKHMKRPYKTSGERIDRIRSSHIDLSLDLLFLSILLFICLPTILPLKCYVPMVLKDTDLFRRRYWSVRNSWVALLFYGGCISSDFGLLPSDS